LLLLLTVSFGLRPNRYWLWLPLIWALYVAFVCGLALGSSAINVYIRDTRYVLESFTTVLFWLVPIFYSFSIIPQKYADIYRVNPVAALVFAMRNILMDGTPPPMSIMVNLTIAASVAVGLGLLIFRRLKLRFYEHI
jgi:ABC-type polysaccharide/polyol phosphate export permease